MGVIDLDARVKKLEQNAGGGGGGSTGVKDVSDLLVANSSLTFAAGSPHVYMWQIGDLVFLQYNASISAGASATGSNTTLGTLDTSIRPEVSVYINVMGQNNTARPGTIGTNGVITSTGGNSANFTVFWTVKK